MSRAGSRCTVTHSWCAQCKWYRCSINCSIIIQSIAFSRLIRARMHYICDFTFRRLKSCIYVPRSYNVPRATIPPYNVPHSGRCKRSSDPFTLDVPSQVHLLLPSSAVHVLRSMYPGTPTMEFRLAKKGPQCASRSLERAAPTCKVQGQRTALGVRGADPQRRLPLTPLRRSRKYEYYR